MTQLPQDDFETCLEKAEAWMKSIHERLKVNDNTQGPRSALETRLRETEKICSLEPDGKLLVDMVLMKAKTLLSESSEDEKHEILVKQGKIKTMFEETTTYMTHCHSRIEWVWLHWNEYLKARDEFTLWVHKLTLTLEPDVELQLGLKEKCWQHEQALVLLRDVNNQSRLLDRLLEEAASLYNRIGDPSVDESVQSAMLAEYKQIKKKTKERVARLEKIWRDHEAYEKDVHHFKSWLNSVIEKLKCCVGTASDSTENRLNMLREIGNDVECGEKQLEVLEVKSAEVIKNTSPLGTEKIYKELEELRRTLAELKLMNNEEEEGLLKTYNSENAFLLLARQLQANIVEFRKAIQRLEESLQGGERVKSEDELLALWKTLNATKSALAAEETKAERVKVQLKDLFKFSKDVQPLSDEVIAAMRDYQRAKSKAFKLSTETESELRQLFQNPLREFLYWKPIAESVLDSTAVPVNDDDMNQDAICNIERLLEESSVIKGNLAALEKKKERMHSVLGDDKTKALLSDISAAKKERAALHQDLLQRRHNLQSLAAQREEFDSAFKVLHKQLSAIRVKAAKDSELQSDINQKEAQVQRLQILLEDLTKLNSPIKALNSVNESNPTHAHRATQLTSDYLMLQRSLENNIRRSTDNINNHRIFTDTLRDLQHWIMVTRGTLAGYQDGSMEWEDWDIEVLLAENSEKDIQRQQAEALGQKVIETSSPEGAAAVHTEITQLIESWDSLQRLYERLSRTLREREQQRTSPKSGKRPTVVAINQTSGLLPDMVPRDPSQPGRGVTSNNMKTGVKHDGHLIQIGMQNCSGHNGDAGNQGLLECEDLSSSDHETFTLNVTGISDMDTDLGLQQPGSSVRIISTGDGTNSLDQSDKSNKKSTKAGTIGVTSRVTGSSDTNLIAAGGAKEFGKSGHSGATDVQLSTLINKPLVSRTTVSTEVDGHSSTDRGQFDSRKIGTNREQRFGHTGKPGSTEDETDGLTNTGMFETVSINTDAAYKQSGGSNRYTSAGRGTGSPDRPTTAAVGIDVTSRTDIDAHSSIDKGQIDGRKINTNGAQEFGQTRKPGSFVAENKVKERAGKSNNLVTSRRSRKTVSLAESVDMTDSPSAPTTAGNKTGDDHMKLLKEFEQWLQAENSKLNRICAAEISSSDGIQTRQSKLQKLQSRVPQGQKIFKSLLDCRSDMMVTDSVRLEDLRYRWMLYKSKLRDSGNHMNLKISEEPRAITKQSGGLCSFLHRVCCAALPLQLLLLLFLLLLFLLPLLLETRNCTLSNNFARSFNLMLKYEGPPPT
ncbi:nesprin-3 isoform X2 [Mixophyes fleayi]|uniref:nesprin-3 isoform X2 n=1 Tax=Mixophyes fleayi TaxID=3061075 RepID=UPI003F4DD745